MRASRLGLLSLGVFLALSAATTLVDPVPKLLAIGWVAFAAMSVAAFLGGRHRDVNPSGLVWAYGLASGAMITSAAVFLVPAAVGHDPALGGFGVAAGILAGFAAHTFGHRLTHLDLPGDHTALELTAHALAAGTIIGAVYTAMPALGPLLGLAIVSHKGPAGFVAARRLRRKGLPVSTILLPASGVGVAALSVSLLRPPQSPGLQGFVFGFAAGIFLHVAMDFLPRCELGGEIYEVAAVSENAHHLLDRLRSHAVLSTFAGGAVVFLAWLAVA